ncbi:MAG: hypothetical protein ACT4TC_17635 [Myxococcaceae bacterium]
MPKGLLKYGLLNDGFDEVAGTLLQLCDQGALRGGLSVAFDVRPDELIGTLCERMGGTARTLRVVDVRDRPHPELIVSYQGREERWDVRDTEGLVHNLNDLLKDDLNAAAVVVLGEWEDSLQLLCVPKTKLRELMRERWFYAVNARDLA